MDVNRIKPSNPSDRAQVRGRKPGQEEYGFGEALRRVGKEHPAHEEGGGHERFSDDVTLLGIPPEELTDSVRKALGGLIEEINALRHQLVQAHQHEDFLSHQMQEEPELGILNERGLTAKLAATAAMVARGEMHAALVHLHIRNLEDLHLVHGHGAAQEALSHAAQVVRLMLEPGDVPGLLGGGDIGLILPATDLAQAEEKARDLCLRLNAQRVSWHGESLALETVWGVAEVTQGTATSVIDAADANLREKLT